MSDLPPPSGDPQGPPPDPSGAYPPPPRPPGPEPSPEERRRLEEWRRYEEWQRYEQWRAWQEHQWRQEWQAHHSRLGSLPAAQGQGSGVAGGPGAAVRHDFPHAEPTPYHLILRTWTYRWWRPVVGLLMLVAGAMVVLPLVTLPVLLVGVAVEESGGGMDAYADALESALSMTDVSPSALLWLNLSLGGLILWTWLIVRVLHNLRPRWLTSVMPKMRWRFLLACLGLSVVALVAGLVAAALIPSAGDPSVGSEVNDITGQTLALLIVMLLTTPLQAAGEEYAFRGYLLQAIGALTKRAWIALVLTSLLFAMAHGLQNFPLFFDRFMFGLIAGWLVIRTGGLEAGIALHILNNLLAFGAGILFGDVAEMVQVSEISWWNIPVTLTQSGVYVVLVLLVARRMKVQRLTAPPAPEGAPQTAAEPAPVTAPGPAEQGPPDTAPASPRDS